MSSNSQRSDASVNADIIIIGAGFAGCWSLYELRRHGYKVKLLEAGSDFGGVWHWNKYPGARVDSETPIYQLGCEKVWRSFNFTERFPSFTELQDYFHHLDKVLDLRKDAVFNARVNEAKYDQRMRRWHIRTETGLQAESQFVIFASGSSNKPYFPNFPGIEKFKGRVLHPCAWPDDFDPKGKKIGLIGQGASGLQILQEFAKQDCDLTVFVRNPPTALPMHQRSISVDESEQTKNYYKTLFRHAKAGHYGGYATDVCETSWHDTSSQERQQRYEDLWRRGSYAILPGVYPEFAVEKQVNAEVYQFWAKKVRARISDPVKRDIMAPLEQFQWIGTKRPNLEDNYYEMIDRPNVKLVDLKKAEIKEVTSDGVITEGQHPQELHKLDVIVMATGYDAVTGSLYDMNVQGKSGTRLQEAWANGIRTHLGMVIPDYPNAIMLYGPQAPSSLVNAPPFIDMQVEWVVELLRLVRRESAQAFEVSQAAAEQWRERNLEFYGQSLVRETPSWWNGANIPGKINEPLLWSGGLQTWWDECQKEAQQGLPNFSFDKI